MIPGVMTDFLARASVAIAGTRDAAMTPAVHPLTGWLVEADGGSLGCLVIGEMSLTLQSKLLRFLEERAFRRVGGSDDIRVDVRVIAATNRDLDQMVRAGLFRQDLYYRLRVLPIVLPPLRARLGDIPELAAVFLRQFRADFNKDVRDISPAAAERLAGYTWPGNVRELRNAVERAVLLAEGPTLGPDDFAALAPDDAAETGLHIPPEGLRFEEIECGLLREALERRPHNEVPQPLPLALRTAAAAELFRRGHVR